MLLTFLQKGKNIMLPETPTAKTGGESSRHVLMKQSKQIP